MVFDPDLIANLVTFAGPEQVMLGTDYPFDMGHYDPVGMLARVERLGAEDQEAIRGRNAARLFGLT
jgi:aminocarboxymuconate-semialdehyde decarboxylase